MPFPFTCFCNKFKPCKTEYLGKYLLPQIDERRQQVAALLHPDIFPQEQKSGIRSATLFLFTCFRSTLLILLSFLLFLCRYHAGVANNRFIGCLVGSFSLKTQALFYEPTPNPFESSFINVKTKRTGKNLPVRFVWRKLRDSNPCAFWANGFQDRLVMTTSISFRLYKVDLNFLINFIFF